MHKKTHPSIANITGKFFLYAAMLVTIQSCGGTTAQQSGGQQYAARAAASGGTNSSYQSYGYDAAGNYNDCAQQFQVFCQDGDLIMFDKPACEAYIKDGQLIVRLQGQSERKIASANNCRLWPYTNRRL